MADIISRLRLESGEFDSKIKRAWQELMAYSEHCRKTGLQMGYANKDARDFAQSLGSMQTTSTTARGKINELSDAFVNIRMMYKQMTDEEKNNQFGKNLAASLDQLKTRIQEAKKELADVTAELNGASSGGKGGFFDGLGSKMDGALAVFGGNVMTKLAGVGVGFVSEIKDMVAQGAELAKQGEGIRIAFERLGRGDLLDGLREATHGTVTDLELMKAAVKFNDFKLPVEELGTMLAFAQQKAKDTGQSVDYMVDSIVTGLGRKSLMILDNLGLSASEIKEKMAETGDMTKAVGEIIREQMAKAGDYVETAADRAAQANVSLQNKMEELGRKFAPLQEASNNMWTSMKIGILDVIGGPLTNLLNKLTEAGRLMNAYGQMGGSGKVGRMIQNLSNAREGNRQSIYQQQQAKIWDYINRRENYMKDRQRWVSGGAQNEELRQRLIDQAKSFGTSNVNDIKAQIDAAKKMLSEYQQAAKQYLNPVKADVDTKGAEQNVESLKVKLIELQAQRKKAIAAGDTDLSKNLAKQISQVKSDIKGLVGSTTSKGRNTAKKEQTELQQNQKRINDLTQQYVSLMAAASEAGKPLTDEQQKQTAEIQRQISELEKRNGLLGLYQEQAQGRLLGVDPKTGGLSMTGGFTGFATPQSMSDVVRQRGGNLLDEKAMKAVNEDISRNLPKAKEKDSPLESGKKLLGGINQLTDGLEKIGIDIPDEIQSVISVIQGVMQVIEAVNTIIGGAQTTALTANTVAMGVLTEALWANTALGWFSNGGIVPHAASGYFVGGHNYSGDVTPIMANAGELILNKAQQGNLASQLESGAFQNLKLDAVISGEQIRMVLNNNGRRTGRGEYVQSTRRRG